MSKASEIKTLVYRLNIYRDAYYNHNQSYITDKEYDNLFDKLVEMEKETGIILSNSPTQTVGYTTVSNLQKVKHNHPLLSLDKTTDIKEFVDFFKRKYMLLMAKLDGLTCSLYYDGGRLIRAETRGNGEIGEDITHNAKAFSNIPLSIPYSGELIIDGECIITTDEFGRINEREHTQYKNPRNLVSGTVRQLNSEIVKNRNVKFLAWKLYSVGNDKKINSHSRRLLELEKLGFEIVPCKDFDDIINPLKENTCGMGMEEIKLKCKANYIPIDGFVGMFDSQEYCDSLGTTGHHPKHSLAFKFYQEDNETTLIDIEWSTSRTGLINPVAVFEPVEIDGTTVSRATLNNVSCIRELELGIGDIITVIKSNQIIPQITQNLTRSNTYKIPTVCPTCHMSSVIRNDNGREMLYCTNPKCEAILHEKIANFASREGMNIVGISDERLRILISEGFISNFVDLYTLSKYREQIEQLQGFGKSSTRNILKAIEASRDCEFPNVLVAIGIPSIGKSTARTIAEYCETKYDKNKHENLLDTFLLLVNDNTDWSQLPSIGESTSNLINEYVNENYYDIAFLIDDLKIKIHNKQKARILDDKSFCITGKLEQYANRNELVKVIEDNGGKVVTSVTSKTDYLITNTPDSGSSKNLKAKKFGTKIISEQEFKDLIK